MVYGSSTSLITFECNLAYATTCFFNVERNYRRSGYLRIRTESSQMIHPGPCEPKHRGRNDST